MAMSHSELKLLKTCRGMGVRLDVRALGGSCKKKPCKSSGPGRDRTCDLGIKSPLLYQLSYRPRR